MARLSISLLGSFQVSLDGRPLTDFGTDKARALLAYLAVEASRPHRRDALAGRLWPESPQARARQSLRQALSHLRQALCEEDRAVPYLLVGREAVQFNPEADYWLDVAEFTALAEASRTHRHQRLERCLRCMRRMEEMASLYGGGFLGGFFLTDSYAFEEWATLQREFLQRRMLDALVRLAAYHQRRGDLGRAIELTHRQVSMEPWREEAHRDLIRLLAVDGQRSAALSQFETCRKVLAVELGVEPTAETTALYERVRGQEGAVAPFTARVAVQDHNLPATPTPFIGREEELAELAELIANPGCRLATLVGPGGIGKTRLALQAAADQIGLFPDGITFVPLAPVDSADHLLSTVADALRFQFHSRGDPEQQLLDYLREKALLLVLDNMEHLLESSELLSRILAHAPEVMLLVTSRERLNLSEEWVYEVAGLESPGDLAADDLEAFSAVALFAQTARRAQRKFLLTEREASFVARICQAVEGMPLALELAAAWIPVRTCEEVARDIGRNLDALATRLRNVPRRHQSLRAAFEHSWVLLQEQEQSAFRELSVFRGGFVEEAAVHVADTSSGVLSSLVDKSLLRRDASGRYDMHRLLRQYGEEKLRDLQVRQQAAEDRLCEYYAGFLQERAAWLRGARQAEALGEIAGEIDNVRFAFQTAMEQGKVGVLECSVDSLGTFYAIRSWHQEGATVFGRAVEHMKRGPLQLHEDGARREAVIGACLAWQGHFRYQLGDYEAAQELLESSLEILGRSGTKGRKAFSLHTLGQILCFGKSDYEAAGRLFEEGLALYDLLGDPYGKAQCLDGLGDVEARQGDHDVARKRYEEGLDLRRQIGDLWGVSVSLGSLGGLAGRQGAYGEARRWFEESLAIGRDLENPRGIAACLHNLSTVAYLQGDYAEAKRLRQETLDICRKIGYRWGIANALKGLGDVACRLEEYDQARRHLGESLALVQEEGDRRSQAFTLNSLGTVMQAMGDDLGAQQYFQQALEAAMEIGEPALALDILMSLAKLQADGDAERALEVLAFVLQHPASEQQTRAQVGPLRSALSSRISADALARAEARGRALELGEIVARILD